jgi:hypothetical protein
VSYGAFGRIKSPLYAPLVWLYFSKKEITSKKAFDKSPGTNKNIIYANITIPVLQEELKKYIPERMYTKIISDLISKGAVI